MNMGITTELDSRPGLYNIGNQWIASGILEWAGRNLYSDIKNDVYEVMISGAEKVPPDAMELRLFQNSMKSLKENPADRYLD